ncbi:15356_t:CDS:10 [Funneliformis geosporum]|uniref:DNA-(apurinic or apyrimidinic site) lyase n=1 Tax=Funneliformis geosporum TaxID=1117311 RepID=A0A9W4SEM3_9GLOM|nr:15356_t:CDS:10 [Funneliformis geosporum]
MPELPEVHRAERACNANLVGKQIVQVETQEDKLVFCGISNDEFERSLINKIVKSTGRWGKYFYFEMNKSPNPVFHFGMTGNIIFKDQGAFSYRKPSKNDPNEWPPKFWKFILTFKDSLNKPSEKVVMAFTDVRRLARIRLVTNSPLQDDPILRLGFDPLRNMPDLKTFSGLVLKRKCPIKALLLDQQFSAGIGNWVADEVLFQSHVHPSQYTHTLIKEQINALHENLVYVCKTAVDVNAESRLFPDNWLFHYRWSKRAKNGAFMPDGEQIVFETVGGRTSAIVPSVQKLPEDRVERIIIKRSRISKDVEPKRSTRQKRKTTTAQDDPLSSSQPVTKHVKSPIQAVGKKRKIVTILDDADDDTSTIKPDNETIQSQQHYYHQPQPHYGYMRYDGGYESIPFVHSQLSQNSIPTHSYHMPQQQDQVEQPVVPTQPLPQPPSNLNVYQQHSSSHFSRQQQSQEPQLLPHQLLWYLAEHYLIKASALPTSSLVNFPALSSQHQQHILVAIKCLESVLTSMMTGNNYMSLVDLKTRFRLSQILFRFTDNIREAENHLQKAMLLAQKLDNVTELKFKMIDLQCNILKSTNNHKVARNLMKSSAFEAMESNMPNWTYHFMLKRSEFYYSEGDFNGCLSVLKQAETMADQRGDVEMKACLLITIAQYAFSSQNYPIAQHALAELSTIHISAAPTTSMTTYSNAASSASSLPVKIRWLSKAEIYTLTFLISGICNRGDNATTKSTLFLTEGLKIVEREIYSNDDNQLPVHEVIKSKKFYVMLKAYMLQHLVDSFLLRSEFNDAEKTIAQLMNWATAYDLWAQFQVPVTLALGMINQCVGKAYEAMEYYKEVEKIGIIIEEIKQEMMYQTHHIDSLRAMVHFLEALSCGDYTRTKEHLAETLKLSSTSSNNQLKALTLSVLGAIFYSTQNEQAEKMLTAAYLLSKNANNDLGCFVSGRLLKDIYEFRCIHSKQAAFNEQHEIIVSKTLTDWSEKSRVVLDLVDDDVSSSTSTLHLHNANESSRNSSSTNIIHSVPGGGGYV